MKPMIDCAVRNMTVDHVVCRTQVVAALRGIR